MYRKCRCHRIGERPMPRSFRVCSLNFTRPERVLDGIDRPAGRGLWPRNCVRSGPLLPTSKPSAEQPDELDVPTKVMVQTDHNVRDPWFACPARPSRAPYGAASGFVVARDGPGSHTSSPSPDRRGAFTFKELAVEPQTSAYLGAASIDEYANIRLFIVADDAFAMRVGHATIECALGAAMAAGE